MSNAVVTEIGAIVPIFIISKGRAQVQRTAGLLKESGLPFSVVVEPQDFDEYEAVQPEYDYLVLPQDDAGYGYVCDWTHRYNVHSATAWYWLLDDDITAFYYAKDGKTIKADARYVLRSAERYWNGPNSPGDIAQGALEFQQYAWAAKGDYVLNGYAHAAVCNNARLLRRVNYDPTLRLKTDKDFTLRVFAAGYRNMRTSHFAFGTTKYGRSPDKGGCAVDYDTEGAEQASVDELCRRWPGVCTPQIKKDGRPDAKVDWRAIAPR